MNTGQNNILLGCAENNEIQLTTIDSDALFRLIAALDSYQKMESEYKKGLWELNHLKLSEKQYVAKVSELEELLIATRTSYSYRIGNFIVIFVKYHLPI